MAGDLFAGIAVRDYAAALPWYEALFGAAPSFFPHETEAVWEVAEHRYVYVVEKPERAGSALLMLFVDDLDAELSRIAGHGIEPAATETHGDVRKVVFHDAEGNEVALGGAPPADR